MDSINNKDNMKRQKVDAFVIDLTDVPPQSPIPKSAGRIKEGASKYTGVTFHKQRNKWHAKIRIDGKQRQIGCYENEEEAAVDYARAVRNKWQAQIMIDGKVRLIGCYEREEEAAIDYARAVFKFKGQGALDKARETKEQNSFIIDLSDVPPQPPIPKSASCVKEGASRYTGVSFDKRMNNWTAQISIEGKQRHIGYYENEEEAAIDYARAVFKYKEKRKIDKIRRFIPTKNSIL
ncbi:hypothetical protein QTG54_009718 [Skeletonema marinoi]|uniref:AP2/ERF domain-containing protein n=1 Tax=Skeletonema marinoi TaxID=267567 RepID=A0AAD8Y5A5_9STRA|nr:hypothetical protein QTG54_009718 [Skeletonema marinoi]